MHIHKGPFSETSNTHLKTFFLAIDKNRNAPEIERSTADVPLSLYHHSVIDYINKFINRGKQIKWASNSYSSLR